MADIAKKRKYSKSDAGQKRPSAAFAEDQQGDRRHDHQQQREDYPDPQFHYIRPSPGFGSPKRYPAETSFKPYTGSVGGGSGGGGHQKGRSSSPRPFYNGFYFRPRRERLNWRSLASVSVDRVVRDVKL